MDFENIPVCGKFDLEWHMDSEDDDTDDWHSIAPVKFFTHELSIRGRLRRLLIRNSSTRLAATFFDLVIKCVICITYIVRVILDDPKQYACNGHPCTNSTGHTSLEANMVFSSTQINWYILLWVYRPLSLWILQIVLSAITFSKALLLIYVATKGHRMDHILTSAFFLEVICCLPVLVTATWPSLLQNLFVPTFLNCWLAKMALERIFNDLHLTRQRFQTISVTLSQQILLLAASMVCMVFTTICGIQHIQRGSSLYQLTMFESLYFVIVTFSTVGYGDITPDIWLGQLFMILMICVAFAFIPRQVEVIASTWMERQKAGGEYTYRTAKRNKHVVVCSSILTVEAVMDFLNEFYAHPKLEEHIVILVSPRELANNMQVILKDPKWTHRVVYIRGSPLKDLDLKRCRINEADACFFLCPRSAVDKAKADHHTILRSWAVKDFAPNCRQYVQLFKAKNKMHLKFAEHVVCEDEFKYALLANNCLYPGLSTLVTLLVHTSSGIEGELATENWQQVYGRHSGNEIYHIQLYKSIFFRQYEGKKFTEASASAHQRFGVALLAVLDGSQADPKLRLNPGPDHVMKSSDFCFYMSVTKEEYSEIKDDAPDVNVAQSTHMMKNLEQISLALQKYQKNESEDEEELDESVFDTITSMMGREVTRAVHQWPSGNKENNNSTLRPEVFVPKMGREMVEGVDHRSGPGRVLQFYSDMGQESFTIGPPPITMYVGSHRSVCHIMKSPRPFCCLEWGIDCEHCTYKNASDQRWNKQLIILAAEEAISGIYNFLIPLRSNYNCLNPIILLLEQSPDKIFLETISQFPMVFWMKGRITSVDHLLRAGINKASHLLIVNRDSCRQDNEETLADAETVVAVQTIFKLFPNTNVITELNQATNMRFMQFQAHDQYSQSISRFERKLKDHMASNLSYIFRLPFAAGQVFSASMLDTLLYQTFVKGYLITFVRLLLGMDTEENSGHLSSIRVHRATCSRFPTYGDLYQGLCTATGEIPIAIYRTEKRKQTQFEGVPRRCKKKTLKMCHSPINPFVGFNNADPVDLTDVIRNRMRSLNLSDDDYDYSRLPKRGSTISYVVTNPSPKRRLRVGDIIYVIQPSSMQAIPTKQQWRPRSQSYSGPSREATNTESFRRSSELPCVSNGIATRIATSKRQPKSVTITTLIQEAISSPLPEDDESMSALHSSASYHSNPDISVLSQPSSMPADERAAKGYAHVCDKLNKNLNLNSDSEKLQTAVSSGSIVRSQEGKKSFEVKPVLTS